MTLVLLSFTPVPAIDNDVSCNVDGVNDQEEHQPEVNQLKIESREEDLNLFNPLRQNLSGCFHLLPRITSVRYPWIIISLLTLKYEVFGNA